MSGDPHWRVSRCTYAGRYLGYDPAEPKWKSLPKFQRARVLFNAHRVWGSLHVVLVEGFFDAMHLHSLGIWLFGLTAHDVWLVQIPELAFTLARCRRGPWH
ncbi:MAG: hypothetical protein ABJM43_20370 [Paracoccaceae bacterium]